MTTRTRSTAADRIVAVVERSSTPLSAAQVAARSKVPAKTVSNLLPILARKGRIVWS
jgi:hypothetical protein